MRNGLFEEINYRIIKGCVGLLSRMSDRRIAAWAGRIGNLWYRMDKRHRTVAVENLAIAYGDDLDAEGRRRQVKSNFTQLARTLLEMPSLMNLNKHNLHRYVFIRGCEHIRSAIQSGKAVVFLTAHMGNWELMALAISLAFDMRVNIVVRPLDSPAANRVLRDIRTRTGNRLIDKYNSMNEISRLLREKKPVGILLDQNASWYEGVYVPFFDHRLPDGRCQIIVEPPLNLRRSGRVTDDVIANTALFNRVIEKHIRSAPDNWFWVHQRWRMKNVPIDTLRRIGHLPLIRV
jgi:KDO2-lipid IV(A) lauroyltransferase